MVKQRASAKESPAGFDPSQVFADTQRVDLFNDPPWETARRLPRRAASTGAGRPSWLTAKAAALGRRGAKRGRHSHKLA